MAYNYPFLLNTLSLKLENEYPGKGNVFNTIVTLWNECGDYKETVDKPSVEIKPLKDTSKDTIILKNKCIATTKEGHPCKSKAVKNSEYCSTHKKYKTSTIVESTTKEVPQNSSVEKADSTFVLKEEE